MVCSASTAASTARRRGCEAAASPLRLHDGAAGPALCHHRRRYRRVLLYAVPLQLAAVAERVAARAAHELLAAGVVRGAVAAQPARAREAAPAELAPVRVDAVPLALVARAGGVGDERLRAGAAPEAVPATRRRRRRRRRHRRRRRRRAHLQRTDQRAVAHGRVFSR